MLTNKKFIAQVGLLIIALIWGATFLVVKDAIHLKTFPPFFFAAVRFSLAAICIIFFVDFKSIRDNAIGPVLCGVILFIGYGFQNYGLEATTPTNSAFITSISVLMVPIILYIFRIEKISVRIWISVILAFIGIQMISPSGFNIGDQLTFGCALSFAIHIIMQDRFKKKSVINFFVIQSSVTALLSFLASLMVEDIHQVVFSNEAIIAILTTGTLGTTFALLVMIWAQKILSASETAIMLAMEPVFAALFSVYFGYEVLGFISYAGGSLVIFAIIFCELSRRNKLLN
jgi:drug/metabolite transporter (DMT)-like permease